MKPEINKYQFDGTGKNPSNKVRGEAHVFTSTDNGAILPTYGSFYTDSVVVYKDGVEQTREDGYKLVHVNSEVQELTGLDSRAIVVINGVDLDAVYTLDYQVVGGTYALTSKMLQDSVDNLTLDFDTIPYDNIIGLPTEFNPTSHLHLISDLYGMEYLIDVLREIRRSIEIGNDADKQALMAEINKKLDRVDFNRDAVLALMMEALQAGVQLDADTLNGNTSSDFLKSKLDNTYNKSFTFTQPARGLNFTSGDYVSRITTRPNSLLGGRDVATLSEANSVHLDVHTAFSIGKAGKPSWSFDAIGKRLVTDAGLVFESGARDITWTFGTDTVKHVVTKPAGTLLSVLSSNAEMEYTIGRTGLDPRLAIHTTNGTTLRGTLTQHGATTVNGTVRFNAGSFGFSTTSNVVRTESHVGHLVSTGASGVDTSTHTNPIFSLGQAYVPGSTSLAAMHGIGYTGSRASFINATDLGVLPPINGWGMYVAQAGKARIYLEGKEGSGYFKSLLESQTLHVRGTSVLDDTLTLKKDMLLGTVDGQGLHWSRNTDFASIRFWNTSDSDTNSRLEFKVGDNSTEYFSWVVSQDSEGTDDLQLMTLRRNQGLLGLKHLGHTVWTQGNDGSGSGLDADLWDGRQFADYLNQGVRTGDNVAFSNIGIVGTAGTTGNGISLYGGVVSGEPGYGLHFSQTANFGTYGGVTSDFATYLTMSGANTRGWIFRHKTGGAVASISATGVGSFKKHVEAGDLVLLKSRGDGQIVFRNDTAQDLPDQFGLRFETQQGNLQKGWFTGSHLDNDGPSGSTNHFNFVFKSTEVRTSVAIKGAGGFYVNNNEVMHRGNDGAGSGFDADLLDGLQGSNYTRRDAAQTITGAMTFGGGQTWNSHINWNGGYDISALGVNKLTIASGGSFEISQASGNKTVLSVTGNNGNLRLGGRAGLRTGTAVDVYNDLEIKESRGFGSTEGTITRIPLVGGGSFSNNNASVTGVIKITLPVGMTNTMMQMTIDIFNYVEQDSSTLLVSGYNHTGGWANVTAACTRTGGVQYRVRFGLESGKAVIYIGEVSTVWSYPKVTVRDLMVGHSNQSIDTWSSGWGISTASTVVGVTKNVLSKTVSNQVIADMAGNGDLEVVKVNNLASNDGFRIYCEGSTTDQGKVFFDVADNGNETINFRQFTSATGFTGSSRLFQLMDGSGYTRTFSHTWVNGNLTVTGTMYETSDRSRKENIQAIVEPYEFYRKVQGKTFMLKQNDGKSTYSAGVIAQDVQAFDPKLVVEDSGTLRMNYTALHGYHVAAIGQLYERNAALEEEVKTLKDMVVELAKRLDGM